MLKAMSRLLFFICLLVTATPATVTRAQDTAPDTVYTGVYITSIHNIDFKEKEYTISLWLWLRYKNRKFDFLDNLEIPQSKNVTRSFATVDSSGGQVYMLMKLQCVMKDEWRINNFPFDKQNLRFSIENSQYDAKSLIFVADTAGKDFDEKFTLRKWKIDSIKINTGVRVYETAFGDPKALRPHSEYSTYKVKLTIKRDAMGLFWKMFLGMYISFLIAFMCFFIHIDGIDSRFSLSVGALFAVVGNKYIVDSALPESTTFTLVDTLHGITLFFIVLIMVANAHVLRLSKKNKVLEIKRFDNVSAIVLFLIYLLVNGYFIFMASR